jgi:hypothetical protein
MNHNKLKHGRDSDPPTLPPAAKQCLEDTEEVAVLRKQIAGLANKLAEHAKEIWQMREAISNLTQAQICSPSPLQLPSRAG